jgi:hypothetical protein
MFDRLSKNFGARWAGLLTLGMLLSPASQAVQSLAVAWDASSSSVAGYHVYYGNNGTNFQYVVDAGTNISVELTGLVEGQTNMIEVVAYDAQGTESTPSNLINYIVPGLIRVTPKQGSRNPTQVSFPVASGHTYKVQASEDLKTWVTIWQTTATSNVWAQFEDVESANMKMRFYRVAWQ